MWPDADSNSAKLYARAEKVEPGGINRLQTWQEPFPVYAASGAGAYVTDADGVRRLDLANNFASLMHGHAHPEITAAVTEQIARGSCFILPTETEIALAELLCNRVDGFERVRFCNTGTEAVMIALKAARARTGRPKIAKLEGAYHGMYDFAEISLDSSPENWGNDPRAVPYTQGVPQSVIESTVVIPYNDTEAAARILRGQGPEIAGILIDPVSLSCGMIPLEQGFIDMIQEVAAEIGALVIFDEVVTFRLGPQGAQGLYGAKPDLTTLGKIVGGGFPVAAIAGNADAMSVFDHRAGKPLNPSSGTFTANPVGMTAGRIALELMTPEQYARMDALGERARAGLRAAMKEAGYPGQVAGLGSMFRIHTSARPMKTYRDTFPTPVEAEATTRLQRDLLLAGFITTTKGCFISTPTTEADIDAFVAAAKDCFAKLAMAA